MISIEIITFAYHHHIKNIMAAYKALPYGISDFRQIRRESLYFVDNSMYLETMEQAGHFLFFIRSRRFGKSLFLSMLRYYYDINAGENFAEMFRGLWIADHPTPWQGKFQVLHLDFSQIGGDAEVLPVKFNQYFGIRLDDLALGIHVIPYLLFILENPVHLVQVPHTQRLPYFRYGQRLVIHCLPIAEIEDLVPDM